MHGGRIYEYAEQSGRMPSELLDFSANINPLGPPASVVSAILGAMDGICHYPDARHADVIRSIRDRFGLDDGQGIFCGNGASEVLDLTMRAVAQRRVFVFEPAFAEYREAANRVGAKVVPLPLHLEGGAVGDPLREAVTAADHGDVVVFNNPHNPSGLCWRRDDFIASLEALSANGVTVVVDESFMDFRWDESDRSVLADVTRVENLVVVRSATKVYAIPGLRFGFGVACEDLAHRIEFGRDRWSVNHLAQVAAAAAYRDRQFIWDTWDWLRAEQRYILDTWGRQDGLKVYPPSVNYFLVHVGEELPVDGILARLEREGMFVRRCANFSTLGDNDIRVAIRSRGENERLWTAFARAVDEG